MTAVRPATTATGLPSSADQSFPPSCRISLLVGESHQIDLVLPSAVPLAALAEPTRDTINRCLRSAGDPELPRGSYVFARAAGMARLAGDLSFAAQGIHDADLIAFLPAPVAQRYEPLIENVATAMARWAKQHFPTVSMTDAVGVAVVLTMAALTVAASIVWRLRWSPSGGWLTPAIFAITAATLVGAAVLASRMDSERFAVGAITWAALAGAALTGATAPPGRHPGAPHAFLAAIVAIAGALLLARFTGRYWNGVAATITIATAVFAAATVRMFFAVPGQRIAVVTLVAVLVASRVAAVIALRLARVPRQSFGSITGRDMYERETGQPEDTVSPVADAPHDFTLSGEQVREVALRSNRVLTGMLLGIAVVQLASSWWAIHPTDGERQWPFVAVVTTIALICILRARGFRDRRHAMTVVIGAAFSLLAMPAHFGLLTASTPTALWSAGCAVGVAAAALVAGAVVPSHIFAEPVREAVEWLEYVALVVVIPFAAWAIGLLHFVRYH